MNCRTRPSHLTGKPDSPPGGRPGLAAKGSKFRSQPASLPASPPSCPASEVLSSAGYHHSSSDFIFTKKNYYFKTHLATRWRTQLHDETFQPSTPRPRKRILRLNRSGQLDLQITRQHSRVHDVMVFHLHH